MTAIGSRACSARGWANVAWTADHTGQVVSAAVVTISELRSDLLAIGALALAAWLRGELARSGST